MRALGTRNYFQCSDGTLEPGFEKVAIYADSSGTPTHVACQLADGRWSSKLGDWEDIIHALEGLTGTPREPEGYPYSSVVQFLRRPCGP